MGIFSSAINPTRPYQLFDKAGNKSDYDAVLGQLAQADIFLFGELHNNPVVHGLQYDITKDLSGIKQGKPVPTIASVESENLTFKEQHQGLGDFVLFVSDG